ncbi:hypothetical protein SAMN05216274_105187 [Cryobacterium levicorallinum]|uniref:Uncharacterized protein n=1 Tax=Cryobacterium levicorallinum TaxID=995038 RepID=A0ABY1ECQ6_9MICO|nr:hypothetical protein SAMN05216274_105187 [Cryobacterium levicorallinum]
MSRWHLGCRRLTRVAGRAGPRGASEWGRGPDVLNLVSSARGPHPARPEPVSPRKSRRRPSRRRPSEVSPGRSARIARRLTALPRISYPDDLPVAARRDDIAAAIRDHQVVIAARSVAERTAQELDTELGTAVGYPGALHRPLQWQHPGQGDDRWHPAALPGGLQGSIGVHRPRDPAHQPGVGHATDDLPGPG